MEWKEVTIADIAILKNGKKRPTSQGTIPVYGGNGIMDYVDVYNDEYNIVVGRVGAYCGSVYLSKGKCWVSDNAISVKAKQGTDNKFLFYLLCNQNINHYHIGGAQPLMTQDIISRIEVSIPKSEEHQHQIAIILSALDSKIENNNKINANLEAQAEALFKSWFVDFTPFKDQPFVDSELGPIPQGWKVGKLGDIALQSTEKVLTRNDVKVLSPITTGKLVLSEEYFTKQVFSKSIRNYKIVKQGAFAYNPARVNIGSLGMNEFKFDGCVSPVYVVFECLKGYSFFFDLFRKTEFFKQAVISFAIGGVRQTLNYSDFALIDATIPPLNIVQSFNEIYLHLKKKISINEEENQRLAALRDTLLPKLMSGEIKL